ncbi:hypothetical protein AcV5_000854 [Taiwanofungus camphoratus]|nr:hypothetical protein AcV5_000854 [Antrodia cinnamomea]
MNSSPDSRWPSNLEAQTVWSKLQSVSLSNPYQQESRPGRGSELHSYVDTTLTSKVARHDKTTSEALASRGPVVSSRNFEKLPFLGPPDPSRWPIEKVCFVTGFLFFPCWILGAVWSRSGEYDSFAELFRWRCRVMTMLAAIIVIAVLITEIAFKGK